MSLGYKTSRAPRTTNLPGGVGSAIAQRAVRRTLPRQSLVDEIAAERRASKRRDLTGAEQPRDTAVIEVKEATRAVSDMGPVAAKKESSVSSLTTSSWELSQHDHDKYEHHWLYGTACVELTCSQTNDVIAQKGERIMFVYPMQTDPNKGDAVFMRVKTTNKTTAELKYNWVCIYSGVDDDVYFVENFSMLQ